MEVNQKYTDLFEDAKSSRVLLSSRTEQGCEKAVEDDRATGGGKNMEMITARQQLERRAKHTPRCAKDPARNRSPKDGANADICQCRGIAVLYD